MDRQSISLMLISNIHLTLFMKKIILITVFVLLPTLILHSQWINDPAIDADIKRGIEYTYNLEFEEAQKEFQKVQLTRPDHPAGMFFLAMVEWWRILISIEDDSRDDVFYAMLEKVIDFCDERLDKNENDLTALFFKGGAIGFRGRLRANRKSWFKAVSDGKDALPIVMDAAAVAPNNADVLLGTGIYNYFASVIPEKYPVVKPLMLLFPKGDKAKGIEMLKQAAEKARYANWEAMYFLTQLYYNYENNPSTALQYAQRLFTKFPRNPVFHRYVGRCNVKLSNWSRVNEVFPEIQKKSQTNQRGYGVVQAREAEYYIGYYYSVVGNYDEAIKHFVRCDELSRQLDHDGVSGFMVMANLRMGYIFDLQRKRNFALKQYDKVLAMTEFENSHSLAERYKKQAYVQQ